MAADKRTVHTDALETLGTIIGETEARDAIHLAVEPVIAGEYLEPGNHVGRLPDGSYGTTAAKKVGIVDPFLKYGPDEGERFWLVIYPRQINSLRHVWTHPDFEDVADLPVGPRHLARSDAEKWMRKWAVKHMSEDYYGDGDGDEPLSEDVAHGFAIQAGYSLSVGPYEDARDHINSEWWDNWEAITGERGNRDEYFSCGC